MIKPSLLSGICNTESVSRRGFVEDAQYISYDIPRRAGWVGQRWGTIGGYWWRAIGRCWWSNFVAVVVYVGIYQLRNPGVNVSHSVTAVQGANEAMEKSVHILANGRPGDQGRKRTYLLLEIPADWVIHDIAFECHTQLANL